MPKLFMPNNKLHRESTLGSW